MMMDLECFSSATGMALSTIALTSSSLDQPMMASAVHSILLPWKSSCKILCKEYTICFHSDINILNHFSIGSEGFTGLIKTEYHDPCQDWLDLINLKLTSPNYPEQYNPDEHCTWTITAPPGHFVTLDFERIHVST